MRSAALGLVLALPAAAEADESLVALGTLVEQSQEILIGTVERVEPEPHGPRGARRATIAVEETLRGSAGGRVVVRGSATNPELPDFGLGIRVLAFLRPAEAGLFDSVAGRHGIIEVLEGMLPATRELMHHMLEGGMAMADVLPMMERGQEPPRVLVGAALEELSRRIGPVDLPLVAAAACDSGTGMLPAARLWAIERAGAMKAGQARACLEETAMTGADRAERLAAAEALGDLGEPASVAALAAVLEPGPRAAGAPERDLVLAAALALGKIGDPAAVPLLMRAARERDLALGSTVVHALGLIGGERVIGALTELSHTHSLASVRDQAARTLQRVRRQVAGGRE